MSLVEKAAGRIFQLHDTVYQRTNGWIGHRLLILPSLLLHTVGAKTGKARTTSLTYARDGDDYSGGRVQRRLSAFAGLVPQFESLAGCRNQRRSKAIRGAGTTGATRRPGPRAAVEDRHQVQQGLPRIPEEDQAPYSCRQAHAESLIRPRAAEATSSTSRRGHR